MQTVFDQIDSFYRFPLKMVGRVWIYVQKKSICNVSNNKSCRGKKSLLFIDISYAELRRHMTFPPLLFSFVDKMIKNFCLEVIHYNN